jgi:hypothetical protein
MVGMEFCLELDIIQAKRSAGRGIFLFGKVGHFT